MATNQESLDTNILLRLLLGDIPAQTERAKQLLLKPDTRFYVDDAAISEVVYVLEKQEKHPRDNIAERLSTLFSYDMLDLSQDLLEEVIPFWATHHSISWTDCYLSAKTAATHTEPLWTLDRKLANQSPTAKQLP